MVCWWYLCFVHLTRTRSSEVTFRNFLNCQHANISFTIENEKQNWMSFLDIQIIREDKIFNASVYRKSTFSGVYTHLDNFLPPTCKFGTVYTLAYRWFQICSSWIKLYTELVCLKYIFSILIVGTKIFLRVLKENQLRMREWPSLSRNIASAPFYLLDRS